MSDIDGDLSNGAVEFCGYRLGGVLKDGVPAPNPTSALEHAAAHRQECSRPPLRRFETREDRIYGSDVVKHPLLSSYRTGICHFSLKRTDSRDVVMKFCRLEAVRDEELGDGAWGEG